MIKNLYLYDSTWNCLLSLDFNVEIQSSDIQDKKNLEKKENNSDENYEILLEGVIYSINHTLNKMNNNTDGIIKINSSLEIEIGKFKVSFWESPTKIKLLGIFLSDSNLSVDKLKLLKKIYDELFITYVVKNPFLMKNSLLDFIFLNPNLCPLFVKEVKKLEASAN